MKKYFSLRKEYYDKGLDFLFKTFYNEDVESFIFYGEVDEEEEISWKPIEKDVKSDLQPIEQKFDINFHLSIVSYFNSYWFADLDGFIDNHYIKLESVLPNIELNSFESNLEGYKSNHHNKIDRIPIGIEGNGLIVVLDNITGKVELEDFERGTFKLISNSLDDLISCLRMEK
ncbi:SecY-interacting protein Syd [Bacillus massilinigeriensis]|uniref:SecY-interacting protein Syd n=1 Tax=Bacillus mediterraneensis TaxID=1805474 RepID=UPI00190E931C|nr:SecY-interacting protein Syd [Bacillus mediterraneensis]